MEQSTKRVRYDDARTLLRRCFRNQLCSQIPFDIWKNILSKTTEDSTRVLGVVAQTCSAFRDLLSFLQHNNLPLAKAYRRDGQIKQAKMCLQNCVDSGNLDAKYHLADALVHDGGWGFSEDNKLGNEMFKELKNSDFDHHPSLFVFGRRDKTDHQKALSLKDPFMIGEYYRTHGLPDIAIPYYIVAANNGNEFAQFHSGMYYFDECGKIHLAILYLYKSASQGYANAQYQLYKAMGEQSSHWLIAARRQGHSCSNKFI
jgi:TPR repeat protein